MSFCGTIKDITEGIDRIKWALDPERAQRDVPRRPQTGEGLAMNPYLDLPSPAQPEAGKLASVYGLENHGLTNLHRVYWNLPTASLYEEIVFRGEARSLAPRPGGGEHRQAHRARRGRQVRGPRAVHRRPRLVGRLQPAVQRREVQRAADAHAGVPAGPRRVRAGLLRRRRPGLPHAHPHRHREGLAQPVRAQPVHEDPRRRGAEAPRAGVHGDLRALLPGFARHRRHAHRDVHHHQLHGAAGHHRRLRLRRRDQEDHLHGAQFPAAAGRRAAHALLGQRRATMATWRCSSAFPAPARRRFRPTPRAT